MSQLLEVATAAKLNAGQFASLLLFLDREREKDRMGLRIENWNGKLEDRIKRIEIFPSFT